MSEKKGSLLIHDPRQRRMEIIHGMRVMNNDALSYQNKSPEKCLQTEEKGKKRKYLEASLWKIRQLSPFIVSVEILLGVEAESNLKRLGSHTVTKWEQPYSRTCGYVKSRMAITLVCSMHLCVQGYRVPVRNTSVQRPQW